MRSCPDLARRLMLMEAEALHDFANDHLFPPLPVSIRSLVWHNDFKSEKPILMIGSLRRVWERFVATLSGIAAPFYEEFV